MNNTTSTTIQNIVNKLPVPIFFEQLPDRKQALKYIEWLNNNSPESKNFNQDQLFREVISKELRIVSMKITEIEILLMVGLNTITLNDFTIDSKSLVAKLISENTDNYDLDIMYRIMAQIMSKLPKDLKERVTGKQKLEIFQKIAQSINIDNKLLEKFISLDPSLNTPISMDIDAGDYNTLNKKYLNELQKYEEAKGYVKSNSIDYATISNNPINTSIKAEYVERPKLDDQVLNNNNNNNNNNNSADADTARYIDTYPDFMLGQNDNTLYYYDNSSGTLSEIPINSTQKPVSIQDLKIILSSDKINNDDIQDLINNLEKPVTTKRTPVFTQQTPYTTKPSNFFDSISSFFSWKSQPQSTTTTMPALKNKYMLSINNSLTKKTETTKPEIDEISEIEQSEIEQ